MLAVGEKLREPRFRLRGCIGARHSEHVEALLTCRADERLLDGGGIR
jgi:hypothetical protein